MKIAVLSGKGGTGKTLVSTNLAYVSSRGAYIDCDVEEPNGHLYFKPTNIIKDEVKVKIPVVEQYLCTGCKDCVNFCKFNALAYTSGRLIVFEDICHSCGGCVMFCPEKAISEKDKAIGFIQKGFFKDKPVKGGFLNIGEASGVPIIKALLKPDKDFENRDIFIDCPPGSACIVMDSIKDADYCLLVAEPTIFGLHNLSMVYELVKLFDKPHGVVINKSTGENDLISDFCTSENIPLLARIPFDRNLGLINSRGDIVSMSKDKYKLIFQNLLERITEEVHLEKATHTKR